MAPRNAVITGAARGIGRAIAVRLASDGCNVVVNDLPSNQATLDDLVSEISSNASGGKATSFAADITIEQNVKDLVENCVETYGTLDIASLLRLASFESTLEDMQSLFDTNFRSVWLGYQCAARQMIKQGKGGRIIGYPNMSVYSASKFAVRGITQAAAQEWGTHNITVNTYCPSLIMTPLDTGHRCLKRNGETKDLVGLVSFLASEEGGFVTGQSILDGGGGTLFD
ncbi:acetoin reductase family protein [Mycena polygramma]|nr:acetoin reductase family protein [Mycena polygramma]